MVVASSDDELAAALPVRLAARDPTIEVQVVRSLADLREHRSALLPDATVIDVELLNGHAGSTTSLAELLAAEAAACVPAIVLDAATPATDASTVFSAGGVGYVARSGPVVDQLADEVIRTRRVAVMASRVGETEHHYQTILDASSDGIFVLVDGVFRFVNSGFAHALQRPLDELLDVARLVDIVVESQQAQIAKAIARVEVEGGHGGLIEMSLLGRDGPRVFEVACRASTVQGRRAVVGVARDVTAVRALQAEVERTRQRAAQVERMRALGELAAGVAHDFNNALGTIIGRLEHAVDKAGRSLPVTEELGVIERAARTAVATVQRIREFGKPSHEDVWEDVDLQKVVHEAVLFARTRVPNDVRLDTALGPTPIIRGNAAELGEVILNLLNNAIDAVAPGGTVSVSSVDEGGQAVVVVEDDGCGMSPDVQARIFEPFFSTKAARGTGLGLSVSHWILRRHDAQIQLQSEPGQGTRFRLVFVPLERAARGRPSLDKASLSILVVDDDESIGEMVSDLLTEQGHEVTVVTSAAAARAAVGERAVDLAITDLDLPDMSGWRLARTLREQQPGILVGLISGWALNTPADEMRERGVDFVLTKPFSIDALHEAITRARAESAG